MEKYLICVNIKGQDIQIEVPDMETAYLLLNDYGAACNYVENLQREDNSMRPQTPEETEMRSDWTLPSTSAVCETVNEKNNEILWTKKRPTEKDLEATSLLLSLREHYKLKFDDKKSNKSKLWHDIALQLEARNFCLGENGAGRCRQKFANLSKSYMACIKHQKTTGTGGDVDLCPFFEELHSILGSKDKSKPKYLQDSFSETSEVESISVRTNDLNEDKENTFEKHTDEGDTDDERIKSRYRFKNIEKKIKPSSISSKILNELQEERGCQQKQFDFMKEHLKKSEEQRDRLLDILEAAFSKKKKREESDSE